MRHPSTLCTTARKKRNVSPKPRNLLVKYLSCILYFSSDNSSFVESCYHPFLYAPSFPRGASPFLSGKLCMIILPSWKAVRYPSFQENFLPSWKAMHHPSFQEGHISSSSAINFFFSFCHSECSRLQECLLWTSGEIRDVCWPSGRN